MKRKTLEDASEVTDEPIVRSFQQKMEKYAMSVKRMTVRMTLKSCPECKQVISYQASACPDCGYALKRENILRSKNVRKMIIGFFIVFGILLLMYWLGRAILDYLVSSTPCCS